MKKLIFILALVASSFLYNWIWPEFEWQTDLNQVFLPPSLQHWFGTDSLGRDVFIRTFLGARHSLLVGTLSASISLIVGSLIGVLSGWRGGWVDHILMRTVEVMQSLPQLVIVCLLMMVYQLVFPLASQSVIGLSLIMATVNWMSFARLARTVTLREKTLPYVESALSLGAGTFRILWAHIGPNIYRPLWILFLVNIPSFLLFESMLSFLGLGVQPPKASWGVMIYEGWRNFSVYPHLLLFPALTLFLVTWVLQER